MKSKEFVSTLSGCVKYKWYLRGERLRATDGDDELCPLVAVLRAIEVDFETELSPVLLPHQVGQVLGLSKKVTRRVIAASDNSVEGLKGNSKAVALRRKLLGICKPAKNPPTVEKAEVEKGLGLSEANIKLASQTVVRKIRSTHGKNR